MRNTHSLDHIVQRAIFDTLVHKAKAAFSELKPKDVDSNLFTYHLQKLIKRGYVEKIGAGKYKLSEKGSYLAGHFSTNEKDFVFGPTTLSLLAVYGRNSEGPLAFMREREPYFHKLSLPSGKVHLGEGLRAAAERELQEKTGYTNYQSLEYAGTAAIYGQDGNHITGIVWRIEVDELKPFTSKTGQTVISDWSKIEVEETIHATQEIVKLLTKQKEPFFIEIDEKSQGF